MKVILSFSFLIVLWTSILAFICFLHLLLILRDLNRVREGGTNFGGLKD